MSISDQITRINTARNTIRNWLVGVGLGTSTDKLDTMATVIEDIANQGAVSANVKEGETYTIPKGYHNGSGTVSGVSGGGNYTLQSKTVTPTKKQQAIAPDSGYYGLDSVTVNAIPDAYQDVSSVTATAGDVLANKIIVTSTGAVTAGTMPNNGAVTESLTTGYGIYTIPEGYHDGNGTVEVSAHTVNLTPSKEEQIISGNNGAFISSVLLYAIPDEYITTDDATAMDVHILSGETAYVGGVKVTGTMVNKGAVSLTIDGINTTYATIPNGYHSGSGKVSLTKDIENALAAI